MFTYKQYPKIQRKTSPYAQGRRNASPAMLARIVSLLPHAPRVLQRASRVIVQDDVHTSQEPTPYGMKTTRRHTKTVIHETYTQYE